MWPWAKVGVKRKSNREIEGYYFDGKKSKTLYKKTTYFY